jgi:hypothetical protein
MSRLKTHIAFDLLSRRFLRWRPDLFRSVRDLGAILAAVQVSPENREIVRLYGLPAWLLPATEPPRSSAMSRTPPPNPTAA